jgi:hypothetical protein
VQNWFIYKRELLVSMVSCAAFGVGFAQTTVNNNGNNNKTTVIIQKQETVVTRAPPVVVVRPSPPPPAPAEFPYQQRDLLPYMSPRCAQLFEVELSRYARRAGNSVVAGVQNEFRTSCPDAIADARRGLYQDKLRQYDAAQNQKMAARSAAQQDKLTHEQCSELLRILAGKRKRLDSMTDGEKSDHQRSEQNYTARCQGV